jgi:choline oxidase
MRQSSSVAYLHPLSRWSGNLDVVTDAPALRIEVENGTAKAVVTARGRFAAEQEIILCGGAIDSPKLCLLSGIGPVAQLQRHGIKVQADLPVGEHLIDHPEGVIVLSVDLDNLPSGPEWGGGGVVALANVPDFSHEAPDVMMWFWNGHFNDFTSLAPYPPGRYVCLSPDVLRPKSEGTVSLRSSDPTAPPVINLNYFSDPEGYDLRMMTAALELAREIVASPPLDTLRAREVSPGATTDASGVRRHIMNTTYTAFHPAGTCRMGAVEAPTTVVGPDLKVKGVDGLRIADASIFPTMVSVNPNVTCMMIGEKCASLVTGDASKTIAARGGSSG